MNRVTKRTWMMGLFLAILLGGMGLFFVQYLLNAETWVTSPGSPHVFNRGNLGFGTVYDRTGNVLLDLTNGRTYSSDAQTRKSTLHWVGDRNGSISAGAVTHYSGALMGYDVVNGVYKGETGGGIEHLTISARIQNAALSALNGRKGTVAVYNYKTGEILCAVTSPTYDPDNVPNIEADTSGAYNGVYINRFLQSSYPPGSIFKIVTAAAALDCVPDIESRTFTCYGEYAYGKQKITCERAHGTNDMKQALAVSCNCAFAQIAELVGRKNMEKYVSQFQITEKVRFDGVTTAAGKYDIKDAGAASFAWSCIGQHSDLINPCRFMVYMGQIAGGGVAATPYIVSRVESNGEITYQAKTIYTDRIMSQALAQQVQRYMRNNVEVTYGSYKFPGLTVCGKSGTAELGEGQVSNAMFSGFCTDEQYPLAFVVAVENGGYGAAACVPILSVVLSECKAVMDSF